ncbi:MAG TPA: secretin N-terminal domain-containing protein, partial [Gammaproteobacteria bacterium]|nr:secretin N-terminal domain-containing protein [Gammaproteobacteria bacterium]
MRISKNGCFFLFLLVLFFSACTTPKPPRKPTSIDEIRADLNQDSRHDRAIARQNINLPTAVSQGLLPPLSSQLRSHERRSEKHFDVSTNKMPAKAFFMGLVEGTHYNMVVNPKVSGEISLKLKNVTIQQVMEIVRDVYGYEYRHTAYGYEVLPQELATQMFTVNYLNVKRIGKSYTDLSSGQISEKITGSSINGNISTPVVASPEKTSGSSIDTRSKMDFWRDLDLTLRAMVGSKEGRSVVVNAQGGLVIVHALPTELHQVARYLDRIQNTMNRQVILEAKILEVQLNDEFQAGIDWNLFGRIAAGNGGLGQQSTQSLAGLDFNLNDFNSLFTLSVYGNFGTL